MRAWEGATCTMYLGLVLALLAIEVLDDELHRFSRQPRGASQGDEELECPAD